LGSGGSTPGGGYIGVSGGGAIQLTVAGTLTVNGLISANGGDAHGFAGGQQGGGSGGSVYIITNAFSGSGAITANGGQSGLATGAGAGGGGGGGRIAVYFQASSFTGSVEAAGGTGAGLGEDGEYGTVGLFDTVNNDFYAGPSWRFQADDSPFDFNTVTLDNGSQTTTEEGISLTAGRLVMDNGSSLSITGEEEFSIDEFMLSGNSTISGNLQINAINFTIDEGSVISADKQGYPGGQGPGAGFIAQWGGSGAGYGGRGGAGGCCPQNPGGLTYGSATAPVELGSGGSWRGAGRFGASGGGAIQLIITGTLTVNGLISANGGDAEQCYWCQEGGGSGGSVYIITNTFSGSGAITANGGRSGPATGAGGGGGGGGRIAVYFQASSFTGSVEAAGGTGASTGAGYGEDGEYGTVVLFDTVNAVLTINPKRGGDTGSVSAVISGSVFTEGSTVKLTRDGEPDIVEAR
jgi:hypothetical protein